jgi:GNAT superfamily N-acetyltransferase
MLTAIVNSLSHHRNDASKDNPVVAAASEREGNSRSYFSPDLTRDGCIVKIRAIRPDDKKRLCEHFRNLSPTSAYFRFFSPKRRVSERDLVGLTEIDFVRNVTLVATMHVGETERIVGLVQYVVADNRLQRAQLACSVVDAYQGRGIGALLIEHILRIARVRGVVEFEADVLGDNHTMLRLLTKSGLAAHRSTQSGVVHLTFSSAEADQFLAAA